MTKHRHSYINSGITNKINWVGFGILWQNRQRYQKSCIFRNRKPTTIRSSWVWTVGCHLQFRFLTPNTILKIAKPKSEKIIFCLVGIVTLLNSAKRWTPVDKQELDKVLLLNFICWIISPVCERNPTVTFLGSESLCGRNWRSLVFPKKTFGSANSQRSWCSTQPTH